MTNLLHGYPDLPEYGPETPVAWLSGDIRRTATSGVDSFVRRAVLQYDGPGNLDRALRTVRGAFQQAARLLGAEVVKHQIGLYRGLPPAAVTNPFYNSSLHPLVPTGYSLVADVQVVPDARRFTITEKLAFIDRWDGYIAAVRGWRPIDSYYEQMLVEPLVDGNTQTVFVDVDQRIERA